MEEKFTYKFNILAFIITIVVFALVTTLVLMSLSVDITPAISGTARIINLFVGMYVARYFSKQQVAIRKNK